MKTIILSLLILPIFLTSTAANYQVITSGFTYSPNELTVNLGDIVNISASTTHPLVQVDKATWDAGQATPMPGGWGTKTSAYSFTATVEDTIYFVCANHVSMGMKGKIIVKNISAMTAPALSAYNIKISPNPANDYFIVDLDKNAEKVVRINLYNSIGILQKTLINDNPGFGEEEYVFEVSEFPSGIYFLEINTGTEKSMKRVIIR